MTPSQVHKRAEAINQAHTKAMEALALEVLEEHVKPFCNRLGVRFCTGMGSWNFDGFEVEATPKRGPRGMSDFDSSNLPPELASMLHIRIDAYNDLGDWMQDYTPPNYKPPYVWSGQ